MLETISKKNGIQPWEKSYRFGNTAPQRQKTNIEDLFHHFEDYLPKERERPLSLVSLIDDKPIKEVSISIKDKTFILCAALNKIQSEIEEAQYIFNLEENWDEEGALEIPRHVLLNAVELLVQYSNYIYRNFGLVITTPEINPCPDGTVDLSFHNDRARLLINVRNEENSIAVYYGDLYDNKIPIKGTVPTDSVFEHLAHWMKNLA